MQVKADSTNQRPPIRLRDCCQFLLLQLLKHETINRVESFRAGNIRTDQRTQ